MNYEIYVHLSTGEIFRTKSVYVKSRKMYVLFWEYLHSQTKMTLPEFETTPEYIKRLLNFKLIEKVQDLPE